MFTSLMGASAVLPKDGSSLIHLDEHAIPSTGGPIWNMWSDPNTSLLYCASGNAGLRCYSIADGTGEITLVDTDDQGGEYRGVWGDDDWIYTISSGFGVMVYTRDGSGNLTYTGEADYVGSSYRGVWADGTFIYIANDHAGIRVYSISELGLLTLLDTQGPGIGGTWDVWGDGNWIYGCNENGGIVSYGVDAFGQLTFKDREADGLGSQPIRGVWGDGTYLYVSDIQFGMRTLSADPVTGILTLLYLNNYALANAVWLEDGFNIIYNAGAPGLVLYNADVNGELTVVNESVEGGNNTYSVHGDSRFLYTGEGGTGTILHSWLVGRA